MKSDQKAAIHRTAVRMALLPPEEKARIRKKTEEFYQKRSKKMIADNEAKVSAKKL